MPALSTDQIYFFQGFWSFYDGQPRPPKAGPRQQGWDAAAHQGGGYGR